MLTILRKTIYISREKEKAFEQFMMKTTSEPRIGRNLIMVISEKPTTNIILNGQGLNEHFPPKTESKARMSILAALIRHCSGSLSHCN